MSDTVQHKFVPVDGVTLHAAELGEGPLVLLLHGFPKIWYSWRHQIRPPAAAVCRGVVLDQRGCARSEQPEDVDASGLLHLAGDVIGLVDVLGEKSAVLACSLCVRRRAPAAPGSCPRPQRNNSVRLRHRILLSAPWTTCIRDI
ncbi:alpha/beta fold hydrolase [Streptomyces sp. DSM 41699]|uniref:Alpha/beta fold hydrolase n=1 Tax=Streptomyces gibsoniae TaxID=3075529 RepID=A0ABU2U1P4_9ACTN|nr:alpha/beta fold hydrolase [Streptomyces sp. DSM 41699]MDT0467098.1 alpha/beta fold hydrolase [Streptomyces sp. DSM 41699]